VRPAVARGVGEEPRMPIGAPRSGVVPEIVDGELRRPSEVPGSEAADGERVALHQARDATFGRAVLAVAVGESVSSEGTAARAAAVRVLVRTSEDVPGLVRDHPVDVVRAPAVVVVVHGDPWRTRVREVTEWILREEGAVRPAGSVTAADVLDVGAHAVPVGV